MLDNALQRESTFVRKKSITVEADRVYSEALQSNCVSGELPTFPDTSWDSAKNKLHSMIKHSVKSNLKSISQDIHSRYTCRYLQYCKMEQIDPEWKA